jgi:hypothetical protein
LDTLLTVLLTLTLIRRFADEGLDQLQVWIRAVWRNAEGAHC